MSQQFLESFIGGILIGAAASLLLWLNGRIAGNSGIIAQALNFKEGLWRLFYLLGLIAGGVVFQMVYPQKVILTFDPSIPVLIAAGLLVGYGTRLGGGCTSGHGICGIARLSVRSIVATVVFMAAGILTVFILRQLGVVWWANSL